MQQQYQRRYMDPISRLYSYVCLKINFVLHFFHFFFFSFSFDCLAHTHTMINIFIVLRPFTNFTVLSNAERKRHRNVSFLFIPTQHLDLIHLFCVCAWFESIEMYWIHSWHQQVDRVTCARVSLDICDNINALLWSLLHSVMIEWCHAYEMHHVLTHTHTLNQNNWILFFIRS